MAYLVVENFLGGLDTRRHVLASKPGTLATLKNGHITRGGEVEKRKAFTTYASLPANTFGLEAAGGKLWCFGSIEEPSMPTGVYYKRLQHPDGLPMTSLISGCAYGGKTFVVAEFFGGQRYAFYDGVIVDDFVNGVARNSMTDIAGFAAHMRSLFPKGGFTATGSGQGILISGAEGKPYSVGVDVDGTITATQTTITTAVEPIPEVLAKGSFIVVAGQEQPANLTIAARSADVDNASFPGITGIYVNGVEITGIVGGSVIRYDDFSNGWSNVGPQFAYTLSVYINQNTPQSGYSAEASVTQLSGADRGKCKINAEVDLGDTANGYIVEIEFDADPSAFNNVDDFLEADGAHVPIVTASPYNAGRFIAKAVDLEDGTTAMSGGGFHGIESVKVDGVEILGERVSWRGSNSVTASLVVDQINNYSSEPEYIASNLEGGKVGLTAIAGTGASANTKVIQVSVDGNAAVQSVVNMTGGSDPVGGVAQTVSVALGGTFTEGSKVRFVLTLDSSPDFPVYIGSTNAGNSKPVHLLTYKSKVHMLSEQHMFSSGLDNPTKWDDGTIGTSAIDMSNNVEGSEQLISATPYQGKLAIFGRFSCQVWNIDVDPAKNFQAQVLTNTGAVSTQSVISFGEIDSFYLSDSGIRSLRSRDASTNAYSSDVGLPIDTLLVEEMRTVGATASSKAVCAIEPLDNRMMVAIGDKIYVLSQFAGSNLYAWSTYEPGFNIERMVVVNGRLYTRSGDTVHLYGGEDNNTYDNCQLELVLPYLDGGKPAHFKSANGIDLTVDGQWTVQLGMDPFSPETRDTIATVDTSTFSLGRITAVGRGTHFGLRLVSSANGYARLANIFVHYELNEAD